MCLWKTLTSFDMASFFSRTVLSSLPSSSAKEGLGEEALPFVLFSDRHKGLRLTALATPDFVPLKLELSSVNMEKVVVCFSYNFQRVCVKERIVD